jgi:hypothetical protein
MRTALEGAQPPSAQKISCSRSAATWDALRHQILPFTSTAATAMRGSSAGATPMNHS